MAKIPMTAQTPIAWIDLESSGLRIERDAILSLGVVRSDGTEREWLIMPDESESFDPESLAINGFTEERWRERGARRADEVVHEVAAFVDGHILGAHNAPFDVPFLRIWARRYGVTLNVPHRALCTVSMLWPLVLAGELESPSHEKACERFGIPLDGHHDALADARRAKRLYEAIVARLGVVRAA